MGNTKLWPRSNFMIFFCQNRFFFSLLCTMRFHGHTICRRKCVSVSILKIKKVEKKWWKHKMKSVLKTKQTQYQNAFWKATKWKIQKWGNPDMFNNHAMFHKRKVANATNCKIKKNCLRIKCENKTVKNKFKNKLFNFPHTQKKHLKTIDRA